MRARRLTIPPILAVTVLGCPEEDGDDETGAETQAATTDGTTGAPSTTGMVDASETRTQDPGDTSEGPAPPDCSVGMDEDSCMTVDGCRWIFNLGCVLECNRIDTQELCEMQLDCVWDGAVCDVPGSTEAI